MRSRGPWRLRGPAENAGAGRLAAPGLVICSSVAAQSGAAYAVQLVALSGPVLAAWIRNSVGAAVLLTLFLVRRGGLSGIRWRVALGYGALLAVMNTSFYFGIQRLPLGDAVAVEFVGPITVAAATTRSRRDLVWVGLAAAGVMAIVRPGPAHLSYAGLAFILIAAACWASYILLGRRLATGARRADTLAAAMTISALLLLLPALSRSAGLLGDPRVLGLGVLVGLVSSAIPYSVELLALGRVTPHVFGILLSLQPMMAGLMGFLILGQRPQPLDYLGFLLVVAASAGVTLTATADRPPAVEPVAVA